jgi:hypothetical protein
MLGYCRSLVQEYIPLGAVSNLFNAFSKPIILIIPKR